MSEMAHVGDAQPMVLHHNSSGPPSVELPWQRYIVADHEWLALEVSWIEQCWMDGYRFNCANSWASYRVVGVDNAQLRTVLELITWGPKPRPELGRCDG